MAVMPRVVWMPGHVRTEVHLGSEETGGAFCLLVDEPPAGWSLPAHLHRGTAETIHILSGEFWMEVVGDRRLLSAGQTVHVPAGAVHAGGTLGESAGRRVVIFSPGGMERFFLEAGGGGGHGSRSGEGLDFRAAPRLGISSRDLGLGDRLRGNLSAPRRQ